MITPDERPLHDQYIRLSKFCLLTRAMLNKACRMTKPGIFAQDAGAIPFQHHSSLSPVGLAWAQDFCADREEVLLTRCFIYVLSTQKI